MCEEHEGPSSLLLSLPQGRGFSPGGKTRQGDLRGTLLNDINDPRMSNIAPYLEMSSGTEKLPYVTWYLE